MIPLVLAALTGMLVAPQAPANAMSIVFVVDVSHSVRTSPPSTWGFRAVPMGPMVPRPGTRLPPWDVIDAFADDVRPGDRVAFGTVAERLVLRPGWSSDQKSFLAVSERAMRDADDAKRDGPSPIWDAVDVAVSLLADQPRPRAIVLVTDGKASGNTVGTEAVARRAVAAGVTVNILLELDSEADFETSPAAPARKLSVATGGVFEADEFNKPRANRKPESQAQRMKRLMSALRPAAGVGVTSR
jgi:hypothetical protein